MKRLFIWGAGEIGKRILKHLSDDWHVIFVDTKKKETDTSCCERSIIGLEEYLEEYREEFILIAHLHEEESIEILQQNRIINYFVHCEFPGEFKEPYARNHLKEYVIRYLGDRTDYVLYGLNPYSIVIDEWINSQYGIHPYILEDKKSNELVQKIKKSYHGLNIIDNLESLKDIKEVCICSDNYHELKEERVFDKYQLTDIYDCSERIACYHNPGIEKFHNLHKNEKCFIVATGPSLTTEDLEKLREKKVLCISMNSIYHIFDKTDWRPDYYAADDYRELEESQNKIEKLLKGKKFIGDTSEKFWKKSYGEDIYCYHKCYEYYRNRLPKFSDDFSKRSYTGATVTYTCMQLAVYMGFKEIYLLGVDFSYNGEDKNSYYKHFYEEKKLESRGFEQQVRLAYMSAEKYTREHGIKIYNATRGGKLEIFERIDFDKCLEKIAGE